MTCAQKSSSEQQTHWDPAQLALGRCRSERHCLCAGKVFDRMSKGVREAPGKALIGELATASGDRPEGAFGEAAHMILQAVCSSVTAWMADPMNHFDRPGAYINSRNVAGLHQCCD
jgi:hypothetical protein